MKFTTHNFLLILIFIISFITISVVALPAPLPALRDLLYNNIVARNVIEAGSVIRARATDVGDSVNPGHSPPNVCELNPQWFSDCGTISELPNNAWNVGGRLGAPALGLLIAVTAAVYLGI